MHQGQQIAFETARVGLPAGKVDDAVRAQYEKWGYGPGYKLPGLLAPHRPRHRPRRPRARELRAWRDHAAGRRHVLQRRARDLSTGQVRDPAGGLPAHGAGEADLVLHAAAVHRQTVRVNRKSTRMKMRRWSFTWLALLPCMHVASADPGVRMHRQQAGEFNLDSWSIAQSTEGKFSVRMPVRFNDFTVGSEPKTNWRALS